MANKNQVISFKQIEIFKPATTARWLREYLESATQQWEIDNYLAFVRTVMIIYYYFTDKEINPDDYREELIHIYKAKEWSP